MSDQPATRRCLLGAIVLAPLIGGRAYAETAPPASLNLRRRRERAVRDAARRLGTRDLSDCDLYSSAMPCPMCQGALYWAGVRRIHTDGTPDPGIVPKLGC